MNITVKQVGSDVWWAYFTETKGGTVNFTGDLFQGSNAETLARNWRPQ